MLGVHQQQHPESREPTEIKHTTLTEIKEPDGHKKSETARVSTNRKGKPQESGILGMAK